MDHHRLVKSSIIRSQQEFEEIFKTGKRAYGRFVFIIYKSLVTDKDQCADYRIAFVAGRRIGNAVIRNRCKRRLREIVRKNPDSFMRYRSLIIAQAAMPEADFDELTQDVLLTAGKLTP